ncbi:DUF4286 family protein [uncultured Dokdonia sp.]|uniref:DUF4286 family protein n=1 Tax=uncultured Dokdonia sp. TaxID=575653 RepID=UPI002610AECB|nr:DUF4286 family protein [uncultured Dokdonia sp.]
MIIYNVTINIEESIEQEWLAWMQQEHIPEMIATGKFVKALMTKVLVEEDMGGVTYSVQYGCPSKEKLQAYYDQDAERLRSQSNRFAGKFVAFRTELEVISQH